MKFDKIFSLIQKNWSFKFDIEVENKEKLVISADIVAKNSFEGNCIIQVIIYNSGTIHIFYKFREIDYDYENLVAINNLNKSLPFLRAYVDQDGDNQRLTVHYSSHCQEGEVEIAKAVNYMVGRIVSDNVLQHLQPILKKTY